MNQLRTFNPRTLALSASLGILLLFSHGTSRAQDAASKAYEKAYGFILEEKWPQAQEAFTSYLKNYLFQVYKNKPRLTIYLHQTELHKHLHS